MNYEMVAGTTANIDIALLTKGVTPDGDMAGMMAELILKDINGGMIETGGDVSIPDASLWAVRYSPDPSDLAVGVYHMRFKVTDAAGKIAYFPSREPDVLIVRPETY